MARNFSGSGQYGSVSGAPSLPITMACWVRPDDVSNEHWFMAVEDIVSGANFHYLHNRPTSGNVGAYSRQEGQSGLGAEAGALTTGVWQHVAGVWASTSSRIAYLNGVAGSEETSTRNPSLTGEILATAWPRSAAYDYDGVMAEVAIWTAALTADEIAALAAGVSPRLIRPDSLYRYRPLLGVDSPEVDYSGNGGNVSLTGSPARADHAPVTMGF